MKTIKVSLTILTTCLLLAPLALLHAADATGQSYEQLVQQRLREGVDAIARSPMISSKKENIGVDICKALLLLTENKDIEQAELCIPDFCGKPLTTYVGKPVPQSRNEAVFRIDLMEKTRGLLSPKAKTAIEDYAWELLTKYSRDITPADADKPFWEFSSSENL